MAAADPSERPMIEHALAYLDQGYPVFPICSPLMGKHYHGQNICTNPGKTPLAAWAPFQERLPTEPEVRVWWARYPKANIGMATGVLSGVLVLDADGTEARKECLKRGGLDQTPTVFTGKVGGAHYHLEYPGGDVRNFARKLPGTDMRAQGGYVLMPPSVHASGKTYEWVDNTRHLPHAPVPAWLTELIHERGAASDDGTRETLDVEEMLAGFPDGKRDDGLFKLACRFRHDGQPQAYAEAMIRVAAMNCRPAFPENDAIRKVRYVYQKYEAGNVGPDVTVDAFFSPHSATQQPVTGPPEARSTEARYPIQSLADLILLNEEDQEQIIDGLIWPHRVTWAFSDPNSGKTLFLLAALMHVAAGRPFCGKTVKQMPVLIFEEDSPLSVVGEYVITLTEIYDFDLATLPIWINKIQGLRITNGEGMDVVREAIDACPQRPGIVLFDACERIVPSDRFNTKELDPLTKTLQRLIGERITPVVIDHTNRIKAEKGKEQEFKANPMERLFGARAKMAISDVMLYFDGFLKNGPVGLIFAKFRGETPAPMTLKFDGATGFDIIESPLAAQNENERLVIRFFNNAGAGEYSVSDVEAGVPLKRRTLERVLSILTKRRWLRATGSTTARRYRLNTETNSF